MGGARSLLSEPWRDLAHTNKENLDFMKSYHPRNKEVKNLKILVHGPVGAGKSSFINSVESTLRGRVTGRVMTDSISGENFTTKYKTFKIQKDPEGFYSFIFDDIMGLERTEKGVNIEDIKLAQRGHVTEGYKFIPGKPLNEGDKDNISSPTLDEKVHALVYVIPAGSISLLTDEVVKKIRDVRLVASDMGIPQFAILTKVDEACPEVKKDISNVYKSVYLKEQVDRFSHLHGIPLNCIFLVKNYQSEFTTNDDIDAQILSALRQMVDYGEDFLNNL